MLNRSNAAQLLMIMAVLFLCGIFSGCGTAPQAKPKPAPIALGHQIVDKLSSHWYIDLDTQATPTTARSNWTRVCKYESGVIEYVGREDCAQYRVRNVLAPVKPPVVKLEDAMCAEGFPDKQGRTKYNQNCLQTIQGLK